MDDILPFPLLAIVGQPELKTALTLALVNPQIGGVLLSGPYGVGKTTAVRGLLDIMPLVTQEVRDDAGRVQSVQMPMRLVELPLNARMEDVVGGVNERVALEQHKLLLEEGVLSRAHRHVLYVDEINLLDPQVVDAILDAAAQGRTLVRRGAVTRLFPSQFVLIGSMNPEEGMLRPQILDRFGLRVWVAPLAEAQQRLEVYRRAQAFRLDAEAFRALYAEQTAALREEVAAAREILPHVVIPHHIESAAISLIQALNIPSHRAEIALFEGVRARAAADFRSEVTITDLQRIAPLALRQRRSAELTTYTQHMQHENTEIEQALASIIAPVVPCRATPKRKAQSGLSAKRKTEERKAQSEKQGIAEA